MEINKEIERINGITETLKEETEILRTENERLRSLLKVLDDHRKQSLIQNKID
jgi:regulator of replication initiation timing